MMTVLASVQPVLQPVVNFLMLLCEKTHAFLSMLFPIPTKQPNGLVATPKKAKSGGKIIVYGYPRPDPTLSQAINSSVFVTKLETFLKFANLPYEFSRCPGRRQYEEERPGESSLHRVL